MMSMIQKLFLRSHPDSPAASGYCVSPATNSSPTGAGTSGPCNSYIANMPFHVCLCSPIWMLITGGIVPLLCETLTFDLTCSLQDGT